MAAIVASLHGKIALVTQAVLPGMGATKWGRIINRSSVAAQTGGVIGLTGTMESGGNRSRDAAQGEG